QTIYWPTSPSGFELKRLAFGPVPGGWFYSANSFAAPEHVGTHLDAPIHFSQSGLTADQVPLDHLVLSAVVIDVSAQSARNADYRLTPADVAAFEQRYGKVPAGSAAL